MKTAYYNIVSDIHFLKNILWGFFNQLSDSTKIITKIAVKGKVTRF